MRSVRPSTLSRALAGAVLAAALASVVWGLTLGFHFERTEEAIYETEVGGALLRVVWPAIPLALAGVITRRTPVGVVCAIVAGVLVVGSTAGTAFDLRPEAGERRVADWFPPPEGAVRDTSLWTGYSFPSLSLAWRSPGPLDRACEAAERSMRSWSESLPERRLLERSCFVSGRRADHVASMYVGPHPDDRRAFRLHLTITRDV